MTTKRRLLIICSGIVVAALSFWGIQAYHEESTLRQTLLNEAMAKTETATDGKVVASDIFKCSAIIDCGGRTHKISLTVADSNSTATIQVELFGGGAAGMVFTDNKPPNRFADPNTKTTTSQKQ